MLSLSSKTSTFSATQERHESGRNSGDDLEHGGGTPSFTAASDSAWLSANAGSGTAPQTLQISAALGTLVAGTYTGHVTVTASGATGSPAIITVTFKGSGPAPGIVAVDFGRFV